MTDESRSPEAPEPSESSPGASQSRSRYGRLLRFVTFVALLDVLALLVGARFAPPDAVTQLLAVGPMLVVAPILAYWLVYRRG
ncbi:DUF7534 family protein [Halobaculum sp. D14]|uniref:DUF7534 family protein n=1 Tax=unclassified Halobaculum TaxID=2640896 RepID=UPI003EB73B6C